MEELFRKRLMLKAKEQISRVGIYCPIKDQRFSIDIHHHALLNFRNLCSQLEVRPSEINPAAGLGLFAGCPISKNQQITFYGGEILSRNLASCRPVTSHLCSTGFGGPVFDGSLHTLGRMDFDFHFYFGMHALASFANSYLGSGRAANSKYKKVSTREEDVYLAECTNTNVPWNSIVLVATKNIEIGEEILTDYGANHPFTKEYKQMRLQERRAAKGWEQVEKALAL